MSTTSVDSLILGATEEAQALLDELYRQTPEPADDSPLNQTGLRAAALVLQSLNSSAILFQPSGGAYFFGVCVGPLAIGAIHFARVLFSRLL